MLVVKPKPKISTGWLPQEYKKYNYNIKPSKDNVRNAIDTQNNEPNEWQ